MPPGLRAALVVAVMLFTSPQSSVDHDLLEARRLAAEANQALNKTDVTAAYAVGLRALEIFERLHDAEGTGRISHLLGLIDDMQGRRGDASARFTRAIEAFDVSGNDLGRATAAHGLLAADTLPREAAERLFDRTLQDARRLGNKTLEGQLYHHRGDTEFANGDYANALKDLQQAVALLEAAGASEHLGTAYNSMGRLYRVHNQVETALSYQLKALALHEKGNYNFFHLQSLNAVAVTYQALGDTQHARTYFERALALAETASSPRIQDFLRANLADVMAASGQGYEDVARLLEGVIARGLDSYPTLRLRALSDTYLKLGRRDAALAAAEKALASCGDRDYDCLECLSQRAEVHAARGDEAAALADIRDALTRIERVRARLVPADFFKQQYTLAQEHIYDRAIALEVRRHAAVEALETAELARSRAFIDLLASRELPLRDAPVAVPLVRRGSDLPSQAAAPAATIADLAATAARLQSTLVFYWVAADSVFIWTMTADGHVRVAQSDIPRARLTALIRSTTPFGDDASARPAGGLVRTPGAPVTLSSGADRAWRDLYDLLIKPVRTALPRTPGALLTIVPHGPLSALAFAALQDSRGRYLIEDYTLHYVPAGAVLQFTSTTRHADARRGNVLLVADPVPPVLSNFERPLARLPGARIETRAIAAMLPPSRVTQLEGARADEKAVRSATSGKSVLHFATHAIVRDGDPFASFLAIGRAGNGDGDGLLTAQEIYGIDLDADLVVLSACKSAGGRVTGDGIATFARAFIYAGAPSIVASLWDVADEPAHDLIREFYRAWFAGAAKARALRGAQLRLLRNLRAGKTQIRTPAGLVSLPEHPAFWAGFALLGEPD